MIVLRFYYAPGFDRVDKYTFLFDHFTVKQYMYGITLQLNIYLFQKIKRSLTFGITLTFFMSFKVMITCLLDGRIFLKIISLAKSLDCIVQFCFTSLQFSFTWLEVSLLHNKK